MNFNKFGRTANLFDKDSAIVYECYIVSNGQWATGAFNTTVRISCASNTQYTLSTASTYSAFRITETNSDNIPSDGSPVSGTLIYYGSGNTYTFTTSNTAKYIIFQANAASLSQWLNELMFNTGSTALPYEPYGNTWHDTPHYIHNTSTDTLTTLPAVLYPNAVTATVGLKGNMVQSSQPSPTTPIQPSETGERTAQLWDISSWDGATAQRGTLERVTNGYKLTATSNDAYTITYGSGIYSYSVIGGNEYTISWTVDNPQIYGVVYIFTGTSVADTPLTTAVASSGSKTFTVPSGHNYVAFRLGVSSIGDEITYTNIMLNTGDRALPHQPYGYKIPISSNSTTTPVYLGEVETTRRIYKYVFTGQEDWTYSASGGKKRVFVVGFDRAQIATSLCSHFDNTDYVSYPDSGKFAVNTSSATQSMIFGVTDMAITSATDWTTYLAQQYANGTPVTVWYVLATPETGIVNEPIRKIGDYADTVSGITIPTIAGANSFDVLTTLKPSEVTVNYKGWHPVSAVHERESGAWT